MCDFGLSHVLGEHEDIKTLTFGTVTHMPPELLVDGQLGKPADVYAFGVICWCVALTTAFCKQITTCFCTTNAELLLVSPSRPDCSCDLGILVLFGCLIRSVLNVIGVLTLNNLTFACMYGAWKHSVLTMRIYLSVAMPSKRHGRVFRQS